MSQHADEPTRLDIASNDEDSGRRVLTLQGEIDPHTTTTLDGAVDEAVREGGTLVLDFEGVTFIDSAGLRSLIRAQRLAGEAGGGLVLRKLRPATERILDITGLNAELTIE